MHVKQHHTGFIWVKEHRRGKYRRMTKREAMHYFPLIFERVRRFNLRRFNHAYGIAHEKTVEGIYDGRFGYDDS